MINGWTINGNSSYMVFLSLSLHSKINSTAVSIAMTIGPTMRMFRIRILNIWVNLTALSLTNHPRYFADFNVY